MVSNLKNLPRTQIFFIKQLRVVLLALRGFSENKCRLRASALTFYSDFITGIRFKIERSMLDVSYLFKVESD